MAARFAGAFTVGAFAAASSSAPGRSEATEPNAARTVVRNAAPTLSIAALGVEATSSGSSESRDPVSPASISGLAAAGLRGFGACCRFGFARSAVLADVPEDRDEPDEPDDVDECVGSAAATPHPVAQRHRRPNPQGHRQRADVPHISPHRHGFTSTGRISCSALFRKK